MNVFKQAKKFIERDVLINLLSQAESKKILSQKKIADNLGIAVGLANVYIKRCISKGWIKISNVPNRRYAYYLTSKGFNEKSRLVAQYFKDSFNFFRKSKQEFHDIFYLCIKKKFKNVAIAGNGELVDMSVIVAKGNNFKLSCIFSKDIKSKKILDVPVTDSYKKLVDMDAVIIADYDKPQEILEELKSNFPKMNFLFPPILSIRIDKK